GGCWSPAWRGPLSCPRAATGLSRRRSTSRSPSPKRPSPNGLLRGRLRRPARVLARARHLRDDPVVPLNELRGVEAIVGLTEQLRRAEPVFRPGGPAEGHLQILRFEVG